VADAFIGCDSIEAAYAYEHLIRAAGWRCVLATQSDVLCDHGDLSWDVSSLGRGKRLRAIRNRFSGGGWTKSLLASVGAAIANMFHPGWVAEAIGQAFAPLGARKVAQQIRTGAVAACDDENGVVSMLQHEVKPTLRRAA
jgi:hypothetical protein